MTIYANYLIPAMPIDYSDSRETQKTTSKNDIVDLKDPIFFEESEYLVVDQCGHTFKREQMIHLYKEALKTNTSVQCPLSRQILNIKEILKDNDLAEDQEEVKNFHMACTYNAVKRAEAYDKKFKAYDKKLEAHDKKLEAYDKKLEAHKKELEEFLEAHKKDRAAFKKKIREDAKTRKQKLDLSNPKVIKTDLIAQANVENNEKKTAYEQLLAIIRKIYFFLRNRICSFFEF